MTKSLVEQFYEIASMDAQNEQNTETGEAVRNISEESRLLLAKRLEQVQAYVEHPTEHDVSVMDFMVFETMFKDAYGSYDTSLKWSHLEIKELECVRDFISNLVVQVAGTSDTHIVGFVVRLDEFAEELTEKLNLMKKSS